MSIEFCHTCGRTWDTDEMSHEDHAFEYHQPKYPRVIGNRMGGRCEFHDTGDVITWRIEEAPGRFIKVCSRCMQRIVKEERV
jgi:hypothetical protein